MFSMLHALKTWERPGDEATVMHVISYDVYLDCHQSGRTHNTSVTMQSNARIDSRVGGDLNSDSIPICMLHCVAYILAP